jgi:hypothetical protein
LEGNRVDFDIIPLIFISYTSVFWYNADVTSVVYFTIENLPLSCGQEER